MPRYSASTAPRPKWMPLNDDPSTRRSFADIDECATDNGGCSDACVNVASSYQCICPGGYAIGPDGKTCEDIDECLSSDSYCQGVAVCLNAIGSYQCLCPNGYLRLNNSCAGILAHVFLFIFFFHFSFYFLNLKFTTLAGTGR